GRAHQLGVLLAHRLDRDGGQLVHEAGVPAAEQPQVADGAAQDAAQHVAAALVGGADAVGDHHRPAADVVGDDAQRHVGAQVAAVTRAGQLGGAVQDPAQGVGLVDVVDALQDRRHALQAHAGVDVLGGQVALDVEVDLAADLAQLRLHEDEVPDLQVAVLVDDRAALVAVLGPAVVVDLRAGAAGAGHAHVPVVVGQPAAL